MAAPATDPVDPEIVALAVRIGLAWRAIRRGASATKLRDYLYGSGDDAIEQGHMDTLDMLALQPAWRMKDLAEALRIDPSSATRAVQRLEKLGLAERQQNTSDKRVVEVQLTAAGKRRHQQVADRRAELMTQVLMQYRLKELPVLADMLERFVSAVDDFVATHDG
jgi:DNA-binding MarR family transcriptional regulator